MEGWLYGLFTLVGVLAGGLFTYLGMKKQLEQQREIGSRHWRRNVRSKPLLKLRDELALAATKQERLVSAEQRLHIIRVDITEERAKEQLKEATDDWNIYVVSGDLPQTLFMQCDKELVDKVEEIIKDYRSSFFDYENYKNLTATEMKEAMKVFERNKTRIIEVQDLINKRLEEL